MRKAEPEKKIAGAAGSAAIAGREKIGRHTPPIPMMREKKTVRKHRIHRNAPTAAAGIAIAAAETAAGSGAPEKGKISPMNNWLKDGERLDDLQRNHYHIIQNPEKFCFGMDAVLLSGFVTVRPGESGIDLGTGTGIIPILLSAKTEGRRFIGLEIQEDMAEMAG